MEKYLKLKFLHNSAENWLWFLGILLIGWLFKRAFSILVSKMVYRIIKKESENVPLASFVDLLKRPIEFFLSLLIIYEAFDELSFPRTWRIIPFGKMRVSDFVDRILDSLFIIAITWILIQLVRFFALVFLKKAEKNELKREEQMVPFFRDIFIAVVIFIAFFFILGFVFKQDVISLITGLGIGGVALALAARATLENLFASFTIFSERPFIVGDDIEMGNLVGKIEKVGFRSTRIRHVDGSLVVVPNLNLVSNTLNNISERKDRRHKFYIRLKLDSPTEKVRNLIGEIQFLIEKNENTNQNDTYVKLDAIGEYSLNILVVFFANTSDYWKSKEIREEINFEISRLIQKNQLELAQPTTTLFGITDEKSIDSDY